MAQDFADNSQEQQPQRDAAIYERFAAEPPIVPCCRVIVTLRQSDPSKELLLIWAFAVGVPGQIRKEPLYRAAL